MAPISKENEVLTVVPDAANPAAATGSFRHEDTASRPQPVALEVPVTVNGARTVVGSDKREPFSETTKTVLVFGNGAVIRLGSPVSPGQLLFLTNEKTKKEVVCQVVKSKNYRSVSGYVELEFTEAVVGFWGMRFPSDRVATPVPARPVAVPPAATGNPVAQVPPTSQMAVPVAASTPKSPGPTPSPVRLAPSSPVQPQGSSPKAVPPAAPITMALPVQSVMALEAPATKGPEPPAMQVSGLSSSLATSLASLLGETDPSSPAPANVSAASAAPQGKQDPSTGPKQNEDLKLQTARLQEQISSLLFSSTSTTNATPHAPAAPAPDGKVISNVTAQVLEVAKSDRGPASSGLPSKIAPPPIKSSFDTEEVRIPAWLEPLARNAAAPASTQELIEREKAKHAAELAAPDEIVEAPLPITAVEPAPSPAPELPGIGNLLPLDEVVPTEDRPSRGSRKGLMLGLIAAGILIAGGAWYFLQPANSAQNVTTPFPQPAASQAHVAAPVIPPVQPPAQPTTLPNVASAPEVSKLASSDASRNPSSAQPASNMTASKSATGSQLTSITKENPRTASSTIPAAEKERISRPAPELEPEPKKAALGEVHLATPMLNRHVAAQNDSDAAPTLGAAPGVSSAGGLDSAFGSGSKQPAAPEAPLPVGGDVTSAKLLSSVSPVYPAIAKNQHVSGDVVIDALIDANGRVTTMKVISGPSLLHQAARDALHQWKYRPATLDGNPVPMHLTVKLQFRIQ